MVQSPNNLKSQNFNRRREMGEMDGIDEVGDEGEGIKDWEGGVVSILFSIFCSVGVCCCVALRLGVVSGTLMFAFVVNPTYYYY